MIFCEWTRKGEQSDSFKSKKFLRDGEARVGIFERIHAVLDEITELNVTEL